MGQHFSQGLSRPEMKDHKAWHQAQSHKLKTSLHLERIVFCGGAVFNTCILEAETGKFL